MKVTDKEHEEITTADIAAKDRESRPIPPPNPAPAMRRPEDEQLAPLFPSPVANEFRGKWSELQNRFVDDPRNAVEQADKLVAQMMQHVAQTLADERKKLEQQWSKGQTISTEDLRLTLRKYRALFERFLSI